MPLCSFTINRLLAGAWTLALASQPANGQSTSPHTIPDAPLSSDIDEVGEGDEDDADGLLPTNGHKTDRSVNMAADELRLSPSEIRARRLYALSVTIGNGMPWQTYSLAASSVVNADWQAGLYVGAGHFNTAGLFEDKSYDLRLNTRTLGAVGRYHFAHLDHVGIEAMLGYAAFDGHITPHGSDDQVSDAQEKLGTSFQSMGLYLGVGAVFTWLWESGVYLEWIPVGASVAKLWQQDFSRDSETARQALRRDIERPAFYGLINLRLGCLF